MTTRASYIFAAVLGLATVSTSHAYDFWAVNTSNALVRYDSAAPGTALSSNAISGLVGSNGVTPDPFGQIADITFVGATLYGIDGNANLYTLNTTSGAATLVSSTFSPAGFDLGVAYDPFISGGGLRVVSDSAENYSASLGGVFTAGSNVFVGTGVGDANQGATLAFSGLAIDPDFGIGYAFDANLDTLFVTNDANFAEFFTVGTLGGDFTALSSIDWVDGSTLIAALSTDSAASSFYSIDTTTGAATLVGAFDSGITAIAVSAIPEPSTYAAFAGVAGLAMAALRRRRVA
jgi:hypothetical protein